MTRTTSSFTMLIAVVCLAIFIYAFSQPEVDTPRRSQVKEADLPPRIDKTKPHLTNGRMEQQIDRTTFKGEWPLVIDNATVTCAGPGAPMVTLVTSAGEFAVNGTAQAHTRLPAIDAVWLQDEANPPARVSIHDLLETGIALCAAMP